MVGTINPERDARVDTDAGKSGVHIPNYRTGKWRDNLELVEHSTSWICFFCGERVAGLPKGWRIVTSSNRHLGWVRICNACNFPTFFLANDKPALQGPYGRPLRRVPDDSRRVYDEARQCCSIEAYSAAVLLCRKLLVHIAHDLQPESPKERRQTFAQYIDWLNDNGYIPPNGKGWVDWLKDRGNAENHEIVEATRNEAERIVDLSYALLLWNYELQAPHE